MLAWATDNYDGVMVFDEAHAMGGVAGGETGFGVTKGSLQGVTGVTLQNRLPEARVVYSSATGATDINNLAYAVRLGLWGPHTAFASREQFINDIRKGGIAAMEVVARELKGSGLYLSRMLSYEGVEYDILEHKLDDRQIAEFDTYAEAWAQVHQNLDRVLQLANIISPSGETLNGQALGAARSRFESSKQRFFGQLLLTCKLPSLFPAIENCLENEKSAVVQLVSTAEAMLDRRVAGLTANERASLDIDLSPRELILDYLQHAFPTRMMETYYDDNGKEHSRPMLGPDGNPVYCAAAEDIRNDMIEMIGAMPPIANALDAIITRFGAEMVAEVTGRTRRLITLSDGKQHLESRSARSNIVETERFMAGDKRILIFSDAGGTGRSYHASLDCANQQQRHHFLLEPGWRADRAIQGLGRTNRTHQAQPPVFRPVTTDCRGERRFISTIARRLDSLGALTRGQRQTGGQNLFDPADNLESEYAKAALVQWFHLLAEGKLKSCSYADFEHRTGLKLSKEGGLTDDLPPIQRWLNRILALPIQLQNDIFDEFLGLFDRRHLEVHQGDRIRWTRNDHRRGLFNADRARVTRIEGDQVTVETSKGIEKKLGKDDPMLKRLDLAYALNAHMAQGLTSDRGIAVMDSRERNLANQKTFLVTVTRLRDHLTLVVDSAARLGAAVSKNRGEKSSALEVTERLKAAAQVGTGKAIAEKSPKVFEPELAKERNRSMDFGI